MLKFEDQNEAVEAGKVRVSAQELTDALRTVEERKEAEARFQADTIPLGQAIEALGVTYTPEEVLEALKAHRERQAAVTAQHERQAAVPVQRAISPQRRRIAAGVAMAGLLASGAFLIFTIRSIPVLVPAPAAPFAVLTPPAAAVTDNFQTKPLSAIGVGEVFHCDTTSLLRIAKGTAGPSTVVEVGALQNDLWIGTRGSTGFEVQGWTTTADALKLANGEEAYLYRSADSFSSTSPITSVHLPLNRLNRIGSSPTAADYIIVQPTPRNSR